MAPPRVILKAGKERALLRSHPWVFSGAIQQVDGEPQAGETVQVADARGNLLACGAYSPQSQIRVRIWSWDPQQTIAADFFRARLSQAIALRQRLYGAQSPSGACRLVHAESDGLPGIIVDRYADTLVMQLLSAGAERWRELLADLLLEETDAARVYERSDAEVRTLEGLPPRCDVLRGDSLPDGIKILEHELEYEVDVAAGHKTGHYLDQRDNRLVVRAWSAGRDVLDCFCYTGGFALNALAGGAKTVLAVDSSGEALAQARKNANANGYAKQPLTWQQADVFQALRGLRDRNSGFDLIILDPPKFAATAALAQKAARGYKDINLLAFKLLRPGGILITFSCSGGVGPELFQSILASAAEDARVNGRILQRLWQAPDHPVALTFPEGAYLKGLVIAV